MVIKLSVINVALMAEQITKQVQSWSPTVTVNNTIVRHEWSETPVHEDEHLAWLNLDFKNHPVPKVVTLFGSHETGRGVTRHVYFRQYVDMWALYEPTTRVRHAGVLLIDVNACVRLFPYEATEFANTPRLHSLAGLIFLAEDRVRVQIYRDECADHNRIMQTIHRDINNYRRSADPLRAQLRVRDELKLGCARVAPVFSSLGDLFFPWSQAT